MNSQVNKASSPWTISYQQYHSNSQVLFGVSDLVGDLTFPNYLGLCLQL